MEYKQFCTVFAWDPQTGYLVPPDHVPSSFDAEILENLCRAWPTLTDSQKQAQMAFFPDLRVTSYQNHKDNVVLHDALTFLLNLYLAYSRSQGRRDQEILLPSHLCVPLYEVSKELGVKPAMLMNTSSNWFPTNRKYLEEPEGFSAEDFEMRHYLTANHRHEKLFFGATIVGSFHMARVVRASVEMQRLAEEEGGKGERMVELLGVCRQAIDKITSEVMAMHEELDPHYFFHKLRPMIAGYEGLLFSGVKLEGQEEVRLSMSGGTAGYDPSFQMFESAFGIKFEGDYKQTQEVLFREGIFEPHRQAIMYWRGCNQLGRPNIRSRCRKDELLKTGYNAVLGSYKSFLGLHSLVVRKFILHCIPERERASTRGTAGTLISQILKRSEVINEQLL